MKEFYLQVQNSNKKASENSLKVLVKSKTPKKILVKLLSMLFRYVPCLTLMNLFRQNKIERKTFSYLISQKEFDFGRLIRVNERYKELSLSMIYRQDSSSLFHANGLPSLMRLLSNDNCFEVSYDENLRRTNLLKLSKSLYTRIQMDKNNTFNYINRSLFNYYREQNLSISDTTNIVKASISYNKENNIMLPLSQIVATDVRLANQLYNNPLLFKYFLFHKSNRNDNVYSFFSKTAVLPLLNDLARFNFSSRITFYQNSNL